MLPASFNYKLLVDNHASRFDFTSCPSSNDAVGVIVDNKVWESLGWPVTHSDQNDPQVPGTI